MPPCWKQLPHDNVRIGVSWYSVMSAWRKGEMSISRFIDFAQTIGADGIEILDAFLYEPGVVRDHLPSSQAIEQFVAEAEVALAKTGVAVHAIAITNDFNHEERSRLILERAKIQLGIDLAEKFSSPIVRVFSGNPTSSDGVEMVRYRTLDALKDLATPTPTLALENHGNVFANPGRLLSILEPLEGNNIGLCFDIGNFVLADVDPREAAAELPAPSVIHVKDFRPVEGGTYRSHKGVFYEGCRLGEGVVPIKEALEVLLEKVGDKPIAIDLEMECGEDGVEATRAGVAWLRELLNV